MISPWKQALAPIIRQAEPPSFIFLQDGQFLAHLKRQFVVSLCLVFKQHATTTLFKMSKYFQTFFCLHYQSLLSLLCRHVCFRLPVVLRRRRRQLVSKIVFGGHRRQIFSVLRLKGVLISFRAAPNCSRLLVRVVRAVRLRSRIVSVPDYSTFENKNKQKTALLRLWFHGGNKLTRRLRKRGRIVGGRCHLKRNKRAFGLNKRKRNKKKTNETISHCHGRDRGEQSLVVCGQLISRRSQIRPKLSIVVQNVVPFFWKKKKTLK